MDYVFFSEPLLRQFVDFATAQGIACELAVDDAIGGDVAILLVSVDDDLPQPAVDVLEERYDALMEEQSTRLAGEAGWIDKRLAGVSVTLDDGTVRTIRLAPELANRLLDQFSAAEIHDLVTAVARSLAGPEEPRLCQDVASGSRD